VRDEGESGDVGLLVLCLAACRVDGLIGLD